MDAQTHRPIKGILKNNSSQKSDVFVLTKDELAQDREDDPSKKSQKWDEMNILATYHPSDKDYGLMKIDEPSTPYHRMVGDGDDDEGAMSDSESNEALTADILAQKLAAAEGMDPKFLAEEESSEEEEEEELTPEEREKKKEFEMKRKHHYNEGMNIKLGRQLIAKEQAGGGGGEEEDDEEDEDEEMQDITDTDGNDGHPEQLQSNVHVL
ncbi:PREDICTED: protein phosphatase inhibitor 2 isoform X2 [Nanorana parkeri]|uniref:protein phosphatase inhibitor 2 isoform X2 n=1 Tax=Nanorana parkeri TaxID=125878 RepID=UPI0008544E62|nr:PREDICTED: protein phosphatase inhibitor 2 isoform X2 [Nanorana parkeri]